MAYCTFAIALTVYSILPKVTMASNQTPSNRTSSESPRVASLRGSYRNLSTSVESFDTFGRGGGDYTSGVHVGNWDLNNNHGPYCPDGQASGRESASCHGKGDRGWDPCCFWAGCDIWAATWDWDGPGGEGTWCHRDQFNANGGTCKKSNGEWDFWTGGYLYDWCDCNDGDYNCKWNDEKGAWKKQMCIATEDNDVWWDWRQCWQWTQDDNCWWNLLEAKCYTDQSSEICYNGFIQAPGDCNSCAPDQNSQYDDQGLLMCWPK